MNTLHQSKKNKLFSIKSIWRLRYRAYAILVMIVLIPILYANNEGLPPQVDAIGYETVSSNILFDQIQKKQYRSTTAQTPISDEEKKANQTLSESLRKAGYDLGFIGNGAYVDLGVAVPSDTTTSPTTNSPTGPIETNPARKPLESLVPRPTNPQRTNFLRYPKYNINVPVIYSTLGDLFNSKANCDANKDPQGCLDFNSPRDNSPADSPIQKKLQDGIVHIAFTALPGEVGNSYIVGHSSNYSWVPSAYNAIFKPLERRSQVGEEFIIYDNSGRELKFKVFEVLEIYEDDTATAYKSFGDKRVVTLQTSILEFVPGKGFLPTKRWLTRGELVV